MLSLKLFSLFTCISINGIQGTVISKVDNFYDQSNFESLTHKQHHFKTNKITILEEDYPIAEFIEFLRTTVVEDNEDIIKESEDLKSYTKNNLALADQMKPFQNLLDQPFETKQFLTTKRKYKFSYDGPTLSLTPIEAHWRKLQNDEKYFDVTDEDEDDVSLQTVKSFKNKVTLPDKPTHVKLVNNYLKNLSEDNMKTFLTKLTSFYNRYYRSKTGVDSSHFIFNSLNDVLSKNHGNVPVTLNYFKHSWPQSSIIARFEGNTKKDEIIIVGAHQDSVNQWIPWFGKAPGADDDGSGSTSIYDAFRVLVESGFKPNRTLEFHWYSGEEAGLLGSQDIAKTYSHQNKNVVAMMHFDMTGHFAKKEQIAVVQDYTDPTLSDFLRNLIDQYSDLKWVNSRCGYACSDHASWNKYGYRSAFPIEDPDIESNSNIHSPRDTVSTISFHHVHQFSRLALAFAIELSS